MLKEVFLSNACIFDLKGSTKEEVFSEMSESLLKAGRINDKDQFIKALLKREAEGPTGMGDGIAIPHGKSSCVQTPTVIFGRHQEGVSYESLDDLPIKYLFMIAVPETTSNEHLKILSSLARKLMHQDFVDSVKKAESGTEIEALL
jgi:fructose-specific phosphotransferase system IIA component